MKYIKRYEEQTEQHKVGDYLLVNPHGDELMSKIIEIIPNIDIWNHIVLTSDDTEYHVSEDEIVRYLTAEEIKKYDLEKSRRKFNI